MSFDGSERQDLENRIHTQLETIRNLGKARDQLVRERDFHQNRANNAVEANARHLQTEADLRRDLAKADDRARVHYAARLDRQTRSLNELQTAHEAALNQLKAHQTGAELAHVRSRLAAKNRVVSEALQDAEQANARAREYARLMAAAKAKNNAECLDELHKQMKQNTAHQANVLQLNQRIVELEKQLVEVATEPAAPRWTLGQVVEYRGASRQGWRRGAIVGFAPRNDIYTVRDEITGDLVTLGVRVRVPMAQHVLYDINIKNAGGDRRFAGEATEEQVNKAIDILKGEIDGRGSIGREG